MNWERFFTAWYGVIFGNAAAFYLPLLAWSVFFPSLLSLPLLFASIYGLAHRDFITTR